MESTNGQNIDDFIKKHNTCAMATGHDERVRATPLEYISVLTQKGLNYSNITALPVNLNMIKINIKKIEFLWSQFDKLGYDKKQIFYSEKF